MKLMVIGARGNLGSELCRQSAHPVIAVGRREWETMTDIDLLDVDVVIHAAADLYTPVSEHPADVIDSGPMLTARLLELLGTHKTPRLMYVSSCAVYGDGATTEDGAPCCPLTINGQINLLNENLIEAYCNRRNIHWESYRLFNTFGGNDRFSVVNRILAAARQGKAITIHNNGCSLRDFVHVADVASILLEMAERRPPYQRINIGTGHGTSIGDLIAAARDFHPGLAVRFDATPDPVAVSVADTERLFACIGPHHHFISVLDTLRATLGAPASGAHAQS